MTTTNLTERDVIRTVEDPDFGSLTLKRTGAGRFWSGEAQLQGGARVALSFISLSDEAPPLTRIARKRVLRHLKEEARIRADVAGRMLREAKEWAREAQRPAPTQASLAESFRLIGIEALEEDYTALRLDETSGLFGGHKFHVDLDDFGRITDVVMH